MDRAVSHEYITADLSHGGTTERRSRNAARTTGEYAHIGTYALASLDARNAGSGRGALVVRCAMLRCMCGGVTRELTP
jgi:hypothetical protein